MTAVRPLPATLVGRFVQLEPLTATLLPELHRAIAHPAVFAGGYGGGPAGLCSDVDEANEAAHIGWTAFDPRVWGTAVNAETKLLLLGTVFDHGFGRVKIQADAINERSRAAIAGIGATFEGIIRRERPRVDGSWRDTAVYSILVDEWPRVRQGLRARLDRCDGRPVVYRADQAEAMGAPA